MNRCQFFSVEPYPGRKDELAVYSGGDRVAVIGDLTGRWRIEPEEPGRVRWGFLTTKDYLMADDLDEIVRLAFRIFISGKPV